MIITTEMMLAAGCEIFGVWIYTMDGHSLGYVNEAGDVRLFPPSLTYNGAKPRFRVKAKSVPYTGCGISCPCLSGLSYFGENPYEAIATTNPLTAIHDHLAV